MQYKIEENADGSKTVWVGELELREKLEQLRALAHGMQIRVAIAAQRPGVDVNTPDDLERIRALLPAPAPLARSST